MTILNTRKARKPIVDEALTEKFKKPAREGRRADTDDVVRIAIRAINRQGARSPAPANGK